MKRGLIITNAYYISTAFEEQCRRLAREFAAADTTVDIKKNDGFFYKIDGGNTECSLAGYDFAVYLDKDIYAARMLEKSGVRLFNRAAAIEFCDDKMLTHIELSGGGIPMPKTLPGLLCYSPRWSVGGQAVSRIEEELSYPLIVKDSRNSLGAGVYKVDDRGRLVEVMDKIKCSPHLFQEYIGSSYGRDVRVIVVGGRVLGGMLRRAANGFKSNIHAGGTGEVFGLTDAQAALALRAADMLGLDYCGVDFLFGDGEELVLSEVNSNALFIEFEKVTGINVAREYAAHILRTIGEE